MTTSLLPDLWFLILTLAFYVYVVLDGFDLGIGILTLLNRDPAYLEASIQTIHGVWHANQTWLVVVGAVLLAAFPLAYGVILAALIIPVGLMLLGLIGRGVALEFHYFLSDKTGWSAWAFGGGSLLAASAQGLSVGTLLMGLPVENGRFAGGVWYWATPLPLMGAVGLPVLYALLGATRMTARTEGPHLAFSRRASFRAACLSLAAAAALVLWGLAARPAWSHDWLSLPKVFVTLLPLALAVLALTILILVARIGPGRRTPFALAAGAVFLGLLGLVPGFYPNVILPDVSIAEAAADPLVLKVMLAGFCVILPIILIYTAYMYRVFEDGIYKARPTDKRPRAERAGGEPPVA
jgi:cytochrome d ubiquinol oxidase subunit II